MRFPTRLARTSPAAPCRSAANRALIDDTGFGVTCSFGGVMPQPDLYRVAADAAGGDRDPGPKSRTRQNGASRAYRSNNHRSGG